MYNSTRGRSPNTHRNDDASTKLLEEQNDQYTNELQQKVSALKSITIDMRGELMRQNKDLDGMRFDMDTAKDFFKHTISKIDTMVKSGGCGMMCYITLFIFVVFFLVYWMLRFS